MVRARSGSGWSSGRSSGPSPGRSRTSSSRPAKSTDAPVTRLNPASRSSRAMRQRRLVEGGEDHRLLGPGPAQRGCPGRPRLRSMGRSRVADPRARPDQDAGDAGQPFAGGSALGAAEQRHLRRPRPSRGHRAHRGTGEQHVAGRVQPDDQDGPHPPTADGGRDRERGRSRITLTASARVVGGHRSLLDLLRAGGRVGTSTPSAPAAVAAPTSLPMSPTTATSGRAPRAAARRPAPCRGGACGTGSRPRARAGTPARWRNRRRAVHPRVHRVDLRPGEQPPGDPGLVAHHSHRDPGGPQRPHRVQRGRHRLDPVRVPVVGHVDDQGAVAVEQHGLRSAVCADARGDHGGELSEPAGGKPPHPRQLLRRSHYYSPYGGCSAPRLEIDAAGRSERRARPGRSVAGARFGEVGAISMRAPSRPVRDPAPQAPFAPSRTHHRDREWAGRALRAAVRRGPSGRTTDPVAALRETRLASRTCERALAWGARQLSGGRPAAKVRDHRIVA